MHPIELDRGRFTVIESGHSVRPEAMCLDRRYSGSLCRLQTRHMVASDVFMPWRRIGYRIIRIALIWPTGRSRSVCKPHQVRRPDPRTQSLVTTVLGCLISENHTTTAKGTNQDSELSTTLALRDPAKESDTTAQKFTANCIGSASKEKTTNTRSVVNVSMRRQLARCSWPALNRPPECSATAFRPAASG